MKVDGSGRPPAWAAAFAVVLALAARGIGADLDTGEIAGRIVNEYGKPVHNATVTARSMVGGPPHQGLSDASGRYRIPGLAPASYRVVGTLVGFGVEVLPISVTAGSSATVDFVLRLLTLDELLNVAVRSPAKIEQRTAEAPGLVSVVTRDQAAAFGWYSLNDILYKQSGFGPAQDYDRRTVSFRGQFEGWNNNHLLHLVDGIPMNDNLYGTAYTSEVSPLFLLKNVELVRGPGSALYGSYATNGVVQVNTVSPDDLERHGQVRARLGDAGLQAYDWVHGLGAQEPVSAIVGFNSYETDGNEYASADGSGRRDADGNLAAFTVNDSRNSRYYWAKLEGHGDLQGLSLQHHEQYWRFQTGHGWLWWIPDFRESMHEGRRVVALSYRPPKGRLTHEHLLRYQRHAVDWNTRYYPNGARGGAYPAGVWERLDTSAHDFLARTQVAAETGGFHVLVGAEADRFSYGGDREHFGNIDVDDIAGGQPAFPDGRSTRLGPWLDHVLDRPVTNLALFGQVVRRGMLDGALDLTLGARYDRTAFDYHDLAAPGRPKVPRRFERVSPRVGLVLFPAGRFTVKLLGGRAFRSPTLTELAGAHTLSLSSNIAELQPELVTTGEAGADWRVNKYTCVRANVFFTDYRNQIAYSTANLNLSANVYSLETAGAEAEVLLTHGRLSGFANYSYATRLDETVIDRTISASPDRLTWAPAHKLNAGLRYSIGPWSVAATGHYQGPVQRRATETGTQVLPFGDVALDLDRFRPRSVPGWFRLDARVARRLPRNLMVAALATNLGDADQRLVKVLSFPFDYRQEGRRYEVSVTVDY
jgi:outer membrane receptor protein involved in Fe transport